MLTTDDLLALQSSPTAMLVCMSGCKNDGCYSNVHRTGMPAAAPCWCAIECAYSYICLQHYKHPFLSVCRCCCRHNMCWCCLSHHHCVHLCLNLQRCCHAGQHKVHLAMLSLPVVCAAPTHHDCAVLVCTSLTMQARAGAFSLHQQYKLARYC